jgi:signal transduction histidine kinase
LRRDVARCRRIIDHLQDFGRVSSGTPEPIDLNQVIENSFILTGERLMQRQVKIDLQLAPDLPLVMADPHRLEQVILNLVANAEHATQEREKQLQQQGQGEGYQKRIQIETRLARDEEQVVASVRDNGCGIPPDTQRHIFEPFFTTKPRGQGTGLGLAISYGIVTEYDGEIYFDSTLNKGTTFTLRFPVHRP